MKAGATVDRLVTRLVESARVLDYKGRFELANLIEAQLLKPHITRKGPYWQVTRGRIEGRGPFERWTEAVRYAKDWHSIIYGVK